MNRLGSCRPHKECRVSKLWQKEYALNSLVERFTVGNDYELDMKLVPSDCFASLAHAKMLSHIGILSDDEYAGLKQALSSLVEEYERGQFIIAREDEDCHTAIENYLTAKLGEAGKKIHTGRSRNDQVIAALRLYGKAAMLSLFDSGFSLVERLLDMAELYKGTPMPGRTHMQIAMPSSVGLWAGAFAEEVLDDLKLLIRAFDMNDQCPLGSAASYGVPLPLDRELVAGLLGFAKVQNNVLYVNNSRGKMESIILSCVDQICLTLSKLAQDLILFSMPEFGYFSLPKELCSGSSIMPQKRNPDGLELVRAKSATISSYLDAIKQIIRALPSGYNRDFQETKEPFLRGLVLGKGCIDVMRITVEKLSVNEQNLLRGFSADIYATDKALELVAKGMSFRDAYRHVGMHLEGLSSLDPYEAIGTRRSTGTTGNLNLDKAKGELKAITKIVTGHESYLETKTTDLFGFSLTLFKE